MWKLGTRLLAWAGDPYSSPPWPPLRLKLWLGPLFLGVLLPEDGSYPPPGICIPNHLPGRCIHQWALARSQAGSLPLRRSDQRVTEKQGEPEPGCRRVPTPSSQGAACPRLMGISGPFRWETGRGTHPTICRFSCMHLSGKSQNQQVRGEQRTGVCFGGGSVFEHVGDCNGGRSS